jgi:hypothetical protein
MHAACLSLGRPFTAAESELAARLHHNWYAKAGDVLTMSDAEATSMGMPLRMKACITALLSDAAASQAEEAAVADPFPEARDTPTPAAAPFAAPVSVQGDDSGWEDLPIEQRTCPDLQRFGFSHLSSPKVSQRCRLPPYALPERSFTEAQREEFDAFTRFLTQPFFGAQVEPIAGVTAAKYCDHMRGMLGWLHSVRGIPLPALSFRTAIPEASRAGVEVAFDYLQWLRTERGVAVRTEGVVVRSIMAAAKFLYHPDSNVVANSGDKPYQDLPVVKELRSMVNSGRQARKVASRTSEESLKWLDWPQYLALVKELKRECALLKPDGTPRPRRDVALSLQRYLIFATLSCVPDRQRTVRELEVGRTLVKEGDRWCIRHRSEDYKTGKAYGDRPPLVLAPRMYPELEAFIGTWRRELNPAHNYLFTQVNGDPFSDKNLWKTFWTASYRITGRKTNPHLIRDSIVTYLRSGSASEKELEALALYVAL